MADTLLVKVINNDTSAVLEGAIVTLKDGVTTIDSQESDVSGLVTFTTLDEEVEYTIEVSATDYYDVDKVTATYNTDGEDIEVTVPINPVRANLGVFVHTGKGKTDSDPIDGLAGVAISVKTTVGAEIEAVTTDTKGFASLDASLYDDSTVYMAVCTKSGYNGVTKYFTFNGEGDMVTVRMASGVSASTYTISGFVLFPDGSPAQSQQVTLNYIGGLISETIGSDEYFFIGQSQTAQIDENGEFEFTVPDKSAWTLNSQFNYPNNKLIVVDGADVALGSIGVI